MVYRFFGLNLSRFSARISLQIDTLFCMPWHEKLKVWDRRFRCFFVPFAVIFGDLSACRFVSFLSPKLYKLVYLYDYLYNIVLYPFLSLNIFKHVLGMERRPLSPSPSPLHYNSPFERLSLFCLHLLAHVSNNIRFWARICIYLISFVCLNI